MPRYRFTLVYEFDNIDDVAAREQFIRRDAQLLTAANTVRGAVKGGNVLLGMKCQRLYAHHEPKRLWAETVVNNADAQSATVDSSTELILHCVVEPAPPGSDIVRAVNAEGQRLVTFDGPNVYDGAPSITIDGINCIAVDSQDA